MKINSLDFFILFLLSCGVVIFVAIIMKGLFAKSEWFLYPDKTLVAGDLFKYNFFLRKHFGEASIYVFNLVFVGVILGILVLSWYDLISRAKGG